MIYTLKPLENYQVLIQIFDETNPKAVEMLDDSVYSEVISTGQQTMPEVDAFFKIYPDFPVNGIRIGRNGSYNKGNVIEPSVEEVLDVEDEWIKKLGEAHISMSSTLLYESLGGANYHNNSMAKYALSIVEKILKKGVSVFGVGGSGKSVVQRSYDGKWVDLGFQYDPSRAATQLKRKFKLRVAGKKEKPLKEIRDIDTILGIMKKKVRKLTTDAVTNGLLSGERDSRYTRFFTYVMLINLLYRSESAAMGYFKNELRQIRDTRNTTGIPTSVRLYAAKADPKARKPIDREFPCIRL